MAEEAYRPTYADDVPTSEKKPGYFARRKERLAEEKAGKQRIREAEIESSYKRSSNEKYQPSYEEKKEAYEAKKHEREMASHKRAKERETIRKERSDLRHPHIKQFKHAGMEIAKAGSSSYGTTGKYAKERGQRGSRKGKPPVREQRAPASYQYGAGQAEGASGLSAGISQEFQAQPQERQFIAPPKVQPDFFGAPKKMDYIGSGKQMNKADYYGIGGNKKLGTTEMYGSKKKQRFY